MPTWATGFYPARFAPGGGFFFIHQTRTGHTHTHVFVCLLFVESGRARFLRSRSALASTVSVRFLGGGGGFWGWSGRSGRVGSVYPLLVAGRLHHAEHVFGPLGALPSTDRVIVLRATVA